MLDKRAFFNLKRRIFQFHVISDPEDRYFQQVFAQLIFEKYLIGISVFWQTQLTESLFLSIKLNRI